MADAHGVDIASDGGCAGYCSPAVKSKRLAATVQSDSLRPFLGGGSTPSQYGRGGGALSKPMFSSCIHPTPTQRAPHSLTTLSKSASGVVSPRTLKTLAQRDPKSPDCVVDDDDNDVNGEEDENDVTMYAQC